MYDRFLGRSSSQPDLSGMLGETMSASTEVMILDDESIVGKRLGEHLAKRGFRVETFCESAAALARLAEKEFDVVVTDIKMKAPNGLEVLRWVREHHQCTQVVVITGYASIETANEAEIVGAFDFVCKPFHLDQVLAIVKRAAKKAKRQR